jgi:putative ABC transport system permease protein
VAATGAATREGFRARREGLMLRAIDPATYRTVAPLRFLEDNDRADELWQELAQGDALFVSGLVQQAFHLTRGDRLRLRTPRGEVDVRVAGFIQDITQGGYTVIGAEELAAAYFGRSARGASLYFARLAPGADFKTVEQALKDGVGTSRRLDIVNSDDYRALIRQAFDQFFALFDVIVIIAVLVGALGVINTLTMSILERAREIAVLRSLGMTRAQIVWMVLAEALALGVIAALMGTGAGLALAAVLIQGMSVNSGWQLGYVFPAGPLMLSLAITLTVSQLAALYPTWRAVRVELRAANVE